jgi:hypothetical protein
MLRKKNGQLRGEAERRLLRKTKLVSKDGT